MSFDLMNNKNNSLYLQQIQQKLILMKGDKVSFRSPVVLAKTARPSIDLKPSSLSKTNYNQQCYRNNGNSLKQLPVNNNKKQPTIQFYHNNINAKTSDQILANGLKMQNKMGQQDFNNMVHSYEIKIKSMKQQFYRNQQQKDKKISELVLEVSHWQHLANKNSISSLQQSNKDVSISSRISQQQKNTLSTQKQELQKQINRISSQNFRLRQSVANLTQNNMQIRSKYTSQISQNGSRISTPQISHTELKSPSKQIKIQQKTKENQHQITNQKMHYLINKLNQELIKDKFRQLNKKYEKIYKNVIHE